MGLYLCFHQLSKKASTPVWQSFAVLTKFNPEGALFIEPENPFEGCNVSGLPRLPAANSGKDKCRSVTKHNITAIDTF